MVNWAPCVGEIPICQAASLALAPRSPVPLPEAQPGLGLWLVPSLGAGRMVPSAWLLFLQQGSLNNYGRSAVPSQAGWSEHPLWPRLGN